MSDALAKTPDTYVPVTEEDDPPPALPLMSKRAPTVVSLESWIGAVLPGLDAVSQDDVRAALRTLSMKVVLPSVLMDLPEMTPPQKVSLLKAMLAVGMAGAKDSGEVGGQQSARIVYVLPD